MARSSAISLGHDDREGVVDHEAPDEHRDHREDQHEGAEEREPVLDARLGLLHDGLTGDGFVAGGQHALDALGQLLLRHARLGGRRNVGERVAHARDLLGRGRVEQRHRGAERAVGAAEPAEPDDGHVLGARGGHDLHGVTDGEVVALGRGGVHDHLVGSLRG
jgi:hypothetical protein